MEKIYELFKIKKPIFIVLSIIIVGIIPLIFSGSTYFILLLCLMGIALISVSGLDILFGYSGQISLGHAAFYAIGAYTSAILNTKLGISPWISMLTGAFFAALIAALLAYPIVNLVHHFLALVTIAFGEIVHLLALNMRITEGHTGILFIERPSIGNFTLGTNLSFFYLIYVFIILLLFAKNRLVCSRIGRGWIAIRENVHAANGIGIDVRKYKILAFSVSAFYTGIAGGLYAHLVKYISPETFVYSTSVVFLIMLLFGGKGSMVGPIVGSVVLSIITEQLQKLGSYQQLIYGVFLLIIVLFLPNGVAGGIKRLFILGKRGKSFVEVK